MRVKPIAFVLLVALALASGGCATTTRKLAVVDYQLQQSTSAIQQSVETAERGGLVPKPAYLTFLEGVEGVGKAGSLYSVALVAYIANRSSENATALTAALAALETAFLKLPSTVKGTSAESSVTIAVTGPQPQKALADGKAALGVK